MQPLREYVRKRDFKVTSEPRGVVKKAKTKAASFVIQEHHATRLHYDFRLEVDGVLKSWSVPKGPSLDPSVKRLAVEVEDHPLQYGKFEGEIPEGQYGAGEVFIWDKGTWISDGDPGAGLRKGHLEFTLKGKRLHGKWRLIRTGKRDGGKPNWLLMKRTDEYVQPGHEAERIADYGSRRERREGPRKKARARHSKAKEDEESIAKAPTGFVQPQLALLVDEPPVGDEWIHETKYDGYRIQARIEKGRVTLFTRTAQDWTAKYGPVAEALSKLKVRDAILDGEMTWMNGPEQFDFQALQNAPGAKDLSPLTYFAFDLLALDGKDLRPLPLLERKTRLEKILRPLRNSQVRYGAHFREDGGDLLRASCQLKMEGIVSKMIDAPYAGGRGETWVKSKCTQRQEFVIGGYTDPQGARVGFGALLLGTYENGKLRYAGRVGTGFDTKFLASLTKKLERLEQKRSPFQIGSPPGRTLHWVRPKLTAEIAFANWTQDGHLRVPVFHGLRDDKPAPQIHRERAVRTKNLDSEPASPRITHPDKIIYRKEKITKGDVANYYATAGRWMLPLIADRPLSLKRCPEGMEETCFFQKHRPNEAPASLLSVPIVEKSGRKTEMAVDGEEGLMELVQMGAYEIHVWNSHRQTVMHPDQFVMDFDPGPGVSWKKVMAAAFEVKELLDGLGLESFVKATGGKGVHVHVPVKPLYTWEQVKSFSHALALEMVSRDPKLYTATMTKSLRRGKIFIDYLRNGYGATAVAPYSVRARPVSSVAMPLEWRQLKDLKSPDQFTLKEALRWLKARRTDPWAGYAKAAKKIPIM